MVKVSGGESERRKERERERESERKRERERERKRERESVRERDGREEYEGVDVSQLLPTLGEIGGVNSYYTFIIIVAFRC